ncbi:META domain-containing protein [Cysteiniphilum marinum]|uniref:META domain-containing protein n=1 Tax=Cysteiniphilum marinum TaxID=2774191 RepID=UPI001F260C4A|nr:META domain-containing protein [Cysteiniphilum marinum]
MKWTLLIVMIFTCGLVGCGVWDRSTQDVEDTKWVPVEIMLSEIPADKDYYLSFSNNNINAYVGCNLVFGYYAIQGGTMSIRTGATRMYCADNMFIERLLIQSLRETARYNRSGEYLLFYNSNNDVVAKFRLV